MTVVDVFRLLDKRIERNERENAQMESGSDAETPARPNREPKMTDTPSVGHVMQALQMSGFGT